jgi:hypothetical protein
VSLSRIRTTLFRGVRIPIIRGEEVERFLARAARRWQRFAAWFFRGRYLLLARSVGLRPVGDAGSPRGTLFVEIDGLGHGHLLKALQRGYLPNLRRLLEAGEYRLYRWRCGLAADTPPIQAGLMYGRRDGIVGFYWWDRSEQRRIVGSNPYHMRSVQDRLAAQAGHPGLLAGGSSYSNIMSGGARWSVLTIAGADPHWYRPGQGLLRALAIALLNPGKIVRFAFDATWEVIQEMEDRAFVVATGRPRILEGAFPLVRILLNVLAREIITAGTRVDMLRGVPVIYTCYIGYDVVGHHSGPISRNALRVLRGIDGAIGRLLETRSWAGRRYNVVLLSDHGMSGCQPVAEALDHDFEAWVEGWWRQGVQATPQYQIDHRRVRRRLRWNARRRRGSLISRIAGGVARRGSGFFRTWGRIGAWVLEIGSSGAIKLGDRFFQAEGEDRQTPRVAVIACGPLVQLWVRDVGRRLQEHEVEALCPGFVQALVDHPAVECVIAKEGDEVVVHGRYGTAYLGPTGGVGEGAAPGVSAGAGLRVEGRNPLEIYDEPDVVARQIASFASMEACGDLICFAASFQPDSLRDATPGAAGERHVYTFENQLGTHASVGGDQGYPFIMLHRNVPFDPSAIVEAADLYPFLDAYVHGDHRAGALKALKPRGRARAGEDLPVPSTTAC